MEKQKNPRAQRAIARAVIAAVLGLILLAVSGFAIVKLIKGAELRSELDGLQKGDYITTNVDMILGYFAEEYTGDKVKTHYAVVPEKGVLYAVILPERYFDSADTIFDATYDFINGRTDRLSSYILVTGTAEELTDDTAAMFYEWFGLNKDWLAEVGLVDAEVTDYTNHVCLTALRGDQTGSVSMVWAWVLTGLAWAGFIYAAIILLRLTLGKYDPKPEAAGSAPEAATETKPETKKSDSPDETEDSHVESQEEDSKEDPEEDNQEADKEGSGEEDEAENQEEEAEEEAEIDEKDGEAE